MLEMIYNYFYAVKYDFILLFFISKLIAFAIRVIPTNYIFKLHVFSSNQDDFFCTLGVFFFIKGRHTNYNFNVIFVDKYF